jgi:hypothetical protein
MIKGQLGVLPLEIMMEPAWPHVHGVTPLNLQSGKGYTLKSPGAPGCLALLASLTGVYSINQAILRSLYRKRSLAL